LPPLLRRLVVLVVGWLHALAGAPVVPAIDAQDGVGGEFAAAGRAGGVGRARDGQGVAAFGAPGAFARLFVLEAQPGPTRTRRVNGHVRTLLGRLGETGPGRVPR